MQLTPVGAATFEGTQLPAPANHIVGGHISAQALLAASLTAPGRAPHSVHTYFLRPGDSRHPVTFEVTDLQEGRTFSARRVTARQGDEILLEAMSSFKAPSANADPVTYQPPFPDVPQPDSLPPVAPHAAESDEAALGQWASLRWFERRIVDGPSATNSAAAPPPARSRIWWRPAGAVGDDPALTASLVAYLSAVMPPRADLSDWLLYVQSSPSSADTLALASGTMFNRNGGLVCTVRQEMYFPPKRA